MTHRELFDAGPVRRRASPATARRRPDGEDVASGMIVWAVVVLGLALWGGSAMLPLGAAAHARSGGDHLGATLALPGGGLPRLQGSHEE